MKELSLAWSDADAVEEAIERIADEGYIVTIRANKKLGYTIDIRREDNTDDLVMNTISVGAGLFTAFMLLKGEEEDEG